METTSSVAGAEREVAPLLLARNDATASLRLDFERDSSTGQTVLAASFQEPPLKVVRAFAVEGGTALVHLHNVSGGLLGGDRLELAVNIGAGAQVQVTTTGATRIYRPRAAALPTLQTNEIVVGENGLLEYLPDAVIPFAGARFSHQQTESPHPASTPAIHFRRQQFHSFAR